MLPRRMLPWLFALTLLWGQTAAFAHTLTHLHAADPALPEQTCEVCLAQAHLGTALPSSPVALSVLPDNPILSPFDAPVRVDLAAHPACARAPPGSVHA